MANIEQYLADIRSAVYGKSVRGSIHDAIQAINEEKMAGVESSAQSAAKAEESLNTINEQITRVDEISQRAEEVAQSAKETKEYVETVTPQIIEAKELIESAISEVSDDVAENRVIKEYIDGVASEVTELAENAAISAGTAIDKANEATTASAEAKMAKTDVEAAKDIVVSKAETIDATAELISQKAKQVADDLVSIESAKDTVESNAELVASGVDVVEDTLTEAQSVKAGVEEILASAQNVSNDILLNKEEILSAKASVDESKTFVTNKATEISNISDDISSKASQVSEDVNSINTAKETIEAKTKIVEDAIPVVTEAVTKAELANSNADSANTKAEELLETSSNISDSISSDKADIELLKEASESAADRAEKAAAKAEAVSGGDFIPTTAIGNTVAGLDEDGKVPLSQLPDLAEQVIVDTELNKSSANAIQNGAVAAEFEKVRSEIPKIPEPPIVDSELNKTSTNAIQNKTVAEEIEKIRGEIPTIPEIPTVDVELNNTSTNAIQNKAVADAIKNVQDSIPTDYLKTGDVGSTVAGLDEDGKVPLSQLPNLAEQVTVDTELNKSSANAIQNGAVAAEFEKVRGEIPTDNTKDPRFTGTFRIGEPQGIVGIDSFATAWRDYECYGSNIACVYNDEQQTIDIISEEFAEIGLKFKGIFDSNTTYPVDGEIIDVVSSDEYDGYYKLTCKLYEGYDTLPKEDVFDTCIIAFDNTQVSNEALGTSSYAEGKKTKANGNYSHAEGYMTEANGLDSHSEGCKTEAKGCYSHAEGYKTEAKGYYSHAEGYKTYTAGEDSHAEGAFSYALGDESHAEGYDTTARRAESHTEGRGTIAGSRCQHVQGKYNKVDGDNKFAHIIGNGADNNNRSNAHTLDWEGNAWYAGDVVGTAKDGNEVSLIKLKEDIGTINGDVAAIRNTLGDEWDSSIVYGVGAYVIHNNSLWKCLVQNSGQIPTDESTYWNQRSISEELSQLNTDLKNKKKYYYSNVSFVDATGDTNIYSLSNLLDTIVVPNISNYKNSDSVELCNGGTCHEGIMFKHNDNYWNILFCGYAEAPNNIVIVGKHNGLCCYAVWG